MYTERFLLAGCGIMGTAEMAVGEPSRLIPALGLFSHPFPFGIMELVERSRQGGGRRDRRWAKSRHDDDALH